MDSGWAIVSMTAAVARIRTSFPPRPGSMRRTCLPGGTAQAQGQEHGGDDSGNIAYGKRSAQRSKAGERGAGTGDVDGAGQREEQEADLRVAQPAGTFPKRESHDRHERPGTCGRGREQNAPICDRVRQEGHPGVGSIAV